MEEWIKAVTQVLLMKSCIRTHQGVVLKPGPLPKYVFDDKVTSNSPDPSLAIRKHIDRCVDAYFSAYFDKNMVEDACKTYSDKKIGSKIASYQQYRATSTFASTQHIHNTMDGSMGVHIADSKGTSYTKSLANGQTAHHAGQTALFAGQTAPAIAGQTVPYLRKIVPPMAGITASLTTSQTGPLAGQTRCLAGQTGLCIAGQTSTLEPLPEFCPMTNSTDLNCYLPHVSTGSHAIPHTHAIALII
uniref:Uncharacterized protein n=1 Tax=Oryza sativa subsp. japonica TaxID=39947 RepID=Q69IS6_ORYSJ|nr:hypothetical protein [Oryza sativa Japonica Group]BAD62540.1 hypothetical protein [Oryza sativa Japonica Group]